MSCHVDCIVEIVYGCEACRVLLSCDEEHLSFFITPVAVTVATYVPKPAAQTALISDCQSLRAELASSQLAD